MTQYAKIGLVVMVSAWSVACAPASGQTAPAAAPNAQQALVSEDVIGRTLEREGLLGALARIDAELGPTLVSDKPGVVVESARVAKLPPAPGLDDKPAAPPLVTWGVASLYEDR